MLFSVRFFFGFIFFSVGEKSPALFLYTQKASDFRYDVSTTKHISKEINMAYLHSTAIGSIDVPGCEGDPSKSPHGDGDLDHLPQACSHCGCLNQSSHDIIRNGTMNSVVLLGQYNFQPVYLKLKKQRYLCKHCRRTTVAVTPLTRRHCFISNAVKYVILEELAQMQSMTFIAQHLNVSTTTVIRQLKTYGDNLNPKPSRLPSHLAIDEFKSVKNV
ncbi:MAG: helix-turn-helix domain-containing protein, partial [Ruoffia tabacinasalis]